jgi:hydroxyethylthiazole kinase-like uncharacterized protein yjeF
MDRLTREQVRSIDRRAFEQYQIPGIVLMENAARAVVDEACRMLDQECCGKILVLCGGGNNGGDGLAVARHLHNRGCEVTIGFTTDPARYRGDALTNYSIVSAMKIMAGPFEPEMLHDPKPMLIIDAIFGTGLADSPREPFKSVVTAVNNAGSPILSVDIPSGMDCDTGAAPSGCITATRTVTFVAEKIAFDRPEARRYLGDVIVGDIGCPVELVEAVLRGG